MKKDGPFAENSEKITQYFNNILKRGEPIIIVSRTDDLSNLTYYKTITKHFDFIIK
jgi:hypothetical protein